MRCRLAILTLLPAFALAQTRTAIDSVNSIPFATKVEKARSLDDVFLRNAEAAKKIRYAEGEAESYANAALTFYFQGKYDQDLSYSLKTLRLYEKSGNRERLAFHLGETGYRMKRRDMARAQAYMEKGKRMAERYGYTKPLLALYNNYGVLKEMQGQLDSALFFYNRSLSTQRKANDSAGIPYSLNNIAGVHLMRKEYDQAEPIFRLALDIRTRRRDRIGMAETYTSLADLAASRGRRGEAMGWARKALALADEMGYLNLAANSHRILSEQYEKAADPVQALMHYKAYTRSKDSILNKDTNSRIAELEVEYETGQKEKALAVQKASLLEKDLEVRRSQMTIAAVSVLALFTAVCGYLLWRQQRMANRQQQREFTLQAAIARIEAQNRLQEQRLSISRDLHDNIGAQLTFIISSVESLRYGFRIQNPSLIEKIGRITDFTRSTIVELRDTIWAMNHADITFEDLKARILNFVEKAKMAAEDVRFTFAIGPGLERMTLSSVAGMNLYRVIQEAVNNALKYASPHEIRIDAALSGGYVTLSVADDGTGFDTEAGSEGNGLPNMAKRMEDIGGECRITSEAGKGTLVSARIETHRLNT